MTSWLRTLGRVAVTVALCAALTAGATAKDGSKFDPSNAEVLDNFLKIALLPIDPELPQIRKFTAPVRFNVLSNGRWPRQMVLRAFELLGFLTGHDIAVATESFNVVLIFTDDIAGDMLDRYRDYAKPFFRDADSLEKTIGGFAGGACYSLPRFGAETLEAALIVVSTQIDDARSYSCFNRALARSFGLLNFTSDMPYSLLSDPQQWADLTAQDHLFLRILYDRRIASGMRLSEAYSAAKEILEDLRPGK
jgi:hypothetical protein